MNGYANNFTNIFLKWSWANKHAYALGIYYMWFFHIMKDYDFSIGKKYNMRIILILILYWVIFLVIQYKCIFINIKSFILIVYDRTNLKMAIDKTGLWMAMKQSP